MTFSPSKLQKIGESVYQRFLDRYAAKTLVINGVDVQTSGHTTGYRSMWSGSRQKGYPSLGAAISSTKAPDLALSFFSSGGYEETGGLVALSRNPATSTGDAAGDDRIINNFVKTFDGLADSNIAYNSNGESQGSYFSDPVFDLINAAKQERLAHLSGQNNVLPKSKKLIQQLGAMRAQDKAGFAELGRWIDHLRNPDVVRNTKLFDDYFDSRANRNADSLREKAAVAIAAFKAGMTASANIGAGGFDTHDDNDDQHYPRLISFLDGLDYVWEALEAAGIAHKNDSDCGLRTRPNSALQRR